MNIKAITAVLALLATTVGCKENDIAYYSESPRLEYETYASCSFNDKDYLNAYIADNKTTEKECKLTVQLIGYLLTETRTYCIKREQDPQSPFEVEARFQNPYTFPTATDKGEAVIQVTCPPKEAVSTQKTKKHGTLKITSDTGNPMHQFGPGREENLVCTLDVVLDIYPSDWNSSYWGVYSTARYFFMMETLKKTLDEIEESQDIRLQLREAYKAYKEQYGPLYDDDGKEIEFNTSY